MTDTKKDEAMTAACNDYLSRSLSGLCEGCGHPAADHRATPAQAGKVWTEEQMREVREIIERLNYAAGRAEQTEVRKTCHDAMNLLEGLSRIASVSGPSAGGVDHTALIDELRRGSSAIFLATEEVAAKSISDLMKRAAAALSPQQPEGGKE